MLVAGGEIQATAYLRLPPMLGGVDRVRNILYGI